MLHLTTGTNGSGKTLFNIKWVRERQLKETRPVFYNGRFDLKEEIQKEWGWNIIDFKDWQDCPDGSIIIVDECHNDMPVRTGKTTVPEPIRMLAEHRRRGFDFYLITQHPGNIDSFVRRLIGNPGWHRHLKRTFGAAVVSRLHWDAVHLNCEKTGAGKNADISMLPFPKEYYEYYNSATLHTNKVKLPKQLYIAIVAIVLAGLGVYLTLDHFSKRQEEFKNLEGGVNDNVGGKHPRDGRPYRPYSPPSEYITIEEYLKQSTPRIVEFPHTAPKYDAVTKPVTAPYPAACLSTKSKGCKCYTQQGTFLKTSNEVCINIVKNGYFLDWNTNAQSDTSTTPITQ